MGEQRLTNYALLAPDKKTFIDLVTEGQPPAPDYFVYDAILNRSNQLAINSMLSHGIRVYLYPGMSHIKAAIFDGWACMGSANFDKLSLQINRELNLATSDADTVNRLHAQVFSPDFERSTEVFEPVAIGLSHRFAEFIADELL